MPSPPHTPDYSASSLADHSFGELTHPHAADWATPAFLHENPDSFGRQQDARACSSSPPSPTGRSSTRGKPGHIPRPRNPFMIFRSELLEEKRISVKVEHDHRQISRIIANLWNELPEEQKDKWRKKADHEKIVHKQKYPDYRYSPVARSQRPLRRKTKRNTESDLSRCREVADLLKLGKRGQDLEQAVQLLDEEHGRDSLTRDPTPPAASEPRRSSPSLSEPPFKDPLLPPSHTPAERPHQIITHDLPSQLYYWNDYTSAYATSSYSAPPSAAPSSQSGCSTWEYPAEMYHSHGTPLVNTFPEPPFDATPSYSPYPNWPQTYLPSQYPQQDYFPHSM